MDIALIHTTLVDVLQTIQATTELECPPLKGKTKPLDELPEFDSKIWPVAIGLIGMRLGISIPADENIFCESATSTALTIDQIVARVFKMVEEQSAEELKQVNADD